MSRIWNPPTIFLLSFLLRAGMLVYGLYQDATSPFKYTDIDYYVFTDASRFVSQNGSPYDRETYRYTPLLAWLLLPTAWFQNGGHYKAVLWFSFGKVLFATGDLVAGWLSLSLLVKSGMETKRALKHVAGIWLLNPMVSTISTRGSSEGLLGVMVVALLWAVMERRTIMAGLLLGLAVHFKIYPVIYGPAVVWWMDVDRGAPGVQERKPERKQHWEPTLKDKALGFMTYERIVFTVVALTTFLGLNALMYYIYGMPFVQHTFLHHVSRVDHRHNFSPYNVLLYLVSSPTGHSSFPFASLPFLPQLLLSGVLLPLAFAKWDLSSTMFVQTFAFVTFNKVCTSQYFMWYIVLLPFYLPTSSLLSNPALGVTLGALWVLSQGLWLQQAYNLEFLGISTFFPGLWGASLLFFAVNCVILSTVVGDMSPKSVVRTPPSTSKKLQ